MKCPKHGWKYAASNRYRRQFCSLCRDLRGMPSEECEHINNWLADYEKLPRPKSASVFVWPMSELYGASVDPDKYESRVSITGINDGSVREAAAKYGLSPSLVHRVRVDLAMEGTEAATERLLNYARRKLRESEVVETEPVPEMATAAD